MSVFKVSQREEYFFPQQKTTTLTIHLPAHQKEKYSMFLIDLYQLKICIFGFIFAGAINGAILAFKLQSND